ncbi:MAG: tetratricopeptide repeat protein, partial [Bacteroidota bacterium]
MKYLFKSFICCFLLIAVVNNTMAQSNATAEEYIRLAENYKNASKPDSAVALYEKAATEFERAGENEKVADAYNQMGSILARQDKFDSAKLFLQKALSICLSLQDTNTLTIARTYITLGVVYAAEDNFTQSLVYHNRALDIRLMKLGEDNSEVATSYGNIGNVYLRSRNFENSLTAHLKAMHIREMLFGKNSSEIIQSYSGLGNVYREMKQYDLSLQYFEKGIIVFDNDEWVHQYDFLSELTSVAAEAAYLSGEYEKVDKHVQSI